LCGKILEECGKKTYLLGVEAGDTDFGGDYQKMCSEAPIS